MFSLIAKALFSIFFIGIVPILDIITLPRMENYRHSYLSPVIGCKTLGGTHMKINNTKINEINNLFNTRERSLIKFLVKFYCE